MFLVWSDSLSVGVASIDAEHKKLIGLANDLHEAMNNRAGASKIGTVLDEMIAYTKTHFGHEEAEMAKHNYPGLPEQRHQHAVFLVKVHELQAEYRKRQNPQVLTIPVWTFLSQWLTGHIKGTDKKFAVWLTRRGLAA